jgi:hypothetical protein
MANFLTVEDSLQLAAGFFNLERGMIKYWTVEITQKTEAKAK